MDNSFFSQLINFLFVLKEGFFFKRGSEMSITLDKWDSLYKDYLADVQFNVKLFDALIVQIDTKDNVNVVSLWSKEFEDKKMRLMNKLKEFERYIKMLKDNDINVDCVDGIVITNGKELNVGNIKFNTTTCMTFITKYKKELESYMNQVKQNIEDLKKLLKSEKTAEIKNYIVRKNVPNPVEFDKDFLVFRDLEEPPIIVNKNDSNSSMRNTGDQNNSTSSNTKGILRPNTNTKGINDNFYKIVNYFNLWILNGYMCDFYKKDYKNIGPNNTITKIKKYKDRTDDLLYSMVLLNIDSNDNISETVTDTGTAILSTVDYRNLLGTKYVSAVKVESKKEEYIIDTKFPTVNYLKEKSFSTFLKDKVSTKDINLVASENPMTKYYLAVNMFVSIFNKLYYGTKEKVTNSLDGISFETYTTVDFFISPNLSVSYFGNHLLNETNQISKQNEAKFYSQYISCLLPLNGGQRKQDDLFFTPWLSMNISQAEVSKKVGTMYSLANFVDEKYIAVTKQSNKTTDPSTYTFHSRSYSIFFNSYTFGYFNNYYPDSSITYNKPAKLVSDTIFVGLNWTPILTHVDEPEIPKQKYEKSKASTRFVFTGENNITGISFPYLYTSDVDLTYYTSNKRWNPLLINKLYHPFIPRKNIMFPIPTLTLKKQTENEILKWVTDKDVFGIGYSFYLTFGVAEDCGLVTKQNNGLYFISETLLVEIYKSFMTYPYNSEISLDNLFKKTMTNIVGPILLILNELYNQKEEEINVAIDTWIKLMNGIFIDLGVTLITYKYANFNAIVPEFTNTKKYDTFSREEQEKIFNVIKKISVFFSLFGTYVIMGDYCFSVNTFIKIIELSISNLKINL